jgi:hypothetical protein
MTPPPLPPVICNTGRQPSRFPLWLALAFVVVGTLLFLGALWLEICAAVGSPAQKASDSAARVFHFVYIFSGATVVTGSIATFVHMIAIVVRSFRQRTLRKND